MSPPVEPPAAFPAQVAATAHVFAERLDDRITVDGDDGHHLQRAATRARGRARHRRRRLRPLARVRGGEHGRRRRRARGGHARRARTPARAAPHRRVLADQGRRSRSSRSRSSPSSAPTASCWSRRRGRSCTGTTPRSRPRSPGSQRVAREAATQSRRARIPVVDGPVAPAGAGALPGPRRGRTRRCRRRRPARCRRAASGSWRSGPRAGSTTTSCGDSVRRPRLAVGPFVLRAETAAIAAAAALAGRRTHFIRTEVTAESGDGRHSVVWSRAGARETRGLGDHMERVDGRHVGERLRAIRRQKGLSLHDVEARSDQEFKASVLGAYERGERAISVPRLLRLAELYRVPPDQLLPRGAPRPRDRPHRADRDRR